MSLFIVQGVVAEIKKLATTPDTMLVAILDESHHAMMLLLFRLSYWIHV